MTLGELYWSDPFFALAADLTFISALFALAAAVAAARAPRSKPMAKKLTKLEKEERRYLHARMQKRVMFIADGEVREFPFPSGCDTPAIRAVRAEYPDATVLNELPLTQAVTLWRQYPPRVYDHQV